jgi:hypothetical protein
MNSKVGFKSTNLTGVTGTSSMFVLTGFDGVAMDYLAKSGVNMRAGTLVAIWNGSTSNLTETTTTDLGNTSAITFSVSNAGTISVSAASGTWTITATARALGV